MLSSDASPSKIGGLIALAASSLCCSCGANSNDSNHPGSIGGDVHSLADGGGVPALAGADGGGVAHVRILADGGSVPADAGPFAGTCDAIEQEHAIEGFDHVDVCSAVKYGTKPPSSGDHYPVWAAYRTYTSPIPEGFWVHNLEHGSIVITYNCPAGCAADVTAAQAMLDALPDDPVCDEAGEGIRHRALITPDPKLDVQFAASAWGWTLRANCFDPVAFDAFARKHYGQGREPICANGDDVSTEPSTCGN